MCRPLGTRHIVTLLIIMMHFFCILFIVFLSLQVYYSNGNGMEVVVRVFVVDVKWSETNQKTK